MTCMKLITQISELYSDFNAENFKNSRTMKNMNRAVNLKQVTMNNFLIKCVFEPSL